MNEPEAKKPDDTLILGSYRLEHANEVVKDVHALAACYGKPCVVHNKTNHSMRSFPQHWRYDRGIMERICPHGIGHPDPDEREGIDTVHGCDGCCAVQVVVETYEYRKTPMKLMTVFCDSCGWWVDANKPHTCTAKA